MIFTLHYLSSSNTLNKFYYCNCNPSPKNFYQIGQSVLFSSSATIFYYAFTYCHLYYPKWSSLPFITSCNTLLPFATIYYHLNMVEQMVFNNLLPLVFIFLHLVYYLWGSTLATSKIFYHMLPPAPIPKIFYNLLPISTISYYNLLRSSTNLNLILQSVTIYLNLLPPPTGCSQLLSCTIC